MITLAEWGALMDAGETTFTVGQVPAPCTAFASRAEAVAAADGTAATLIQWDGYRGRQLTVDWDAEPEAGQ